MMEGNIEFFEKWMKSKCRPNFCFNIFFNHITPNFIHLATVRKYGYQNVSSVLCRSNSWNVSISKCRGYIYWRRWQKWIHSCCKNIITKSLTIIEKQKKTQKILFNLIGRKILWFKQMKIFPYVEKMKMSLIRIYDFVFLYIFVAHISFPSYFVHFSKYSKTYKIVSTS